LADGLARYLSALGLARLEKETRWPWEDDANQDLKPEAVSDQGDGNDSETDEGESKA